MNMKQWFSDMMQAEKKKSIPVLSFPSIQLQNITVRELISSSDAQASGMAAIAKRCPTAAAVSMMDLSVEAECFGAQIRVTDDEVPTVIGAVLSEPEDADKKAMHLHKGDNIVMTAGNTNGASGNTNLIKVETI